MARGPGETDTDVDGRSAATAVERPRGDAALAPTLVPPDAATLATMADDASASTAGPADVTAPSGDRAPDLAGLATVDPSIYALGPEIARGGMGRILAARDRRLGRDVAIKVLRDRGAASARFEREALITARLQHPSIVRVYDAGRLEGDPFYAMERVRGRSLDRVIAAAKDAGARLALLPHVIAVADALAYAHSEGVIHRDLKPANVLVGSFGETVVIDWGLAKDLHAEEPPSGEHGARAAAAGASDHDLTIAGAVMGTPAYMSPEQARGEAADPRSDVYAIGALLYSVLAGAAPIADPSKTAEGDAGRRDLVPLRDRVPETPAELISIVERAMAHEARARYATASELADELRRFAAGQLVASHVYSTGTLIRRWLRRHRAAVAVAATAVVVVAVLAIVAVVGIVHERDRADRESALARAALRRAEDEADDLVIRQAERAVGEDPALALAWLQRLTPRGLARPRAYELATDAAARGVGFELTGPRDDVELVIAGGDGTAYTASDDGHVWKWSLAELHGTDLGAHTGPIEALARSPDGHWVASGGTDSVIKLWDVATGESRALTGHTGAVRGLEFSPDSAALASASEDGTLRVWTIAAGDGRVVLHDDHDLRPVQWSRDGAQLWTGTSDGRMFEVDVATGATRTAKAHDAEVRVLALSPDGAAIASGGEDGVVKLWSTAGLQAQTLGRHADVVRDLVWTPDGANLISAGGDTIVRVYHVAGGSLDLLGNTSGIKHLALSASGALVASAGLDGTVRVWPITGGEPRVLAGHRASVKSVAFTRSGDLLSGSDDDHLRLWPLAAPPPVPRDADGLIAWLAARTNVRLPEP